MTWLDRCDGSEDLRFYFGVTSREVSQYLSTFSNPMAFAQRTQYESASGWGKGFVWVTQSVDIPLFSWALGEYLKAVLLHEVGHILGNGHHEGTIMTKDLSQIILNSFIVSYPISSLSEPFPLPPQIDISRALVYCGDCSKQFSPVVESAEKGALLFRELLGREATGKLDVKLTRDRDNYLNLHFQDAQGDYSFEPTVGSYSLDTHYERVSPLFKTCYAGITRDRDERSQTMFWEIPRLSDKKPLSLILTDNNEGIFSSGEQIGITLLEHGMRQTLLTLSYRGH